MKRGLWDAALYFHALADELRTYSSDRFKLALKTILFATY